MILIHLGFFFPLNSSSARIRVIRALPGVISHILGRSTVHTRHVLHTGSKSITDRQKSPKYDLQRDVAVVISQAWMMLLMKMMLRMMTLATMPHNKNGSSIEEHDVVSPCACLGGGGGTPSFSGTAVGLLSPCTILRGLALLNCCILWRTLSLAGEPLGPAEAATEDRASPESRSVPPPTTTTSSSSSSAAAVAAAPGSLLWFLLGCMDSPGFLRTRFSSFEQRSTKSWSESSMTEHLVSHVRRPGGRSWCKEGAHMQKGLFANTSGKMDSCIKQRANVG